MDAGTPLFAKPHDPGGERLPDTRVGPVGLSVYAEISASQIHGGGLAYQLTPPTSSTVNHSPTAASRSMPATATKPKLTPEGKQALDAWFKAEVAKGTHPGMFAIVATATEVLYESARGNKVFGQPEKGAVDWDTSGWLGSAGADSSAPALEHDQARDERRVPPAHGAGARWC